MTAARDDLILKLGRNRVLAHQAFFKHRHPQATPEFHFEMIQIWHSDIARAEFMAFRGAAKSTIAEEAIITEASLALFKNAIIIGESGPRANERLASIKHEFETNEVLRELFGEQIGDTWNENKIVLRNGACIQAFGRGMSMRGVKHLDYRPDRLFGDDMEDEESVATPDARAKLKRWFLGAVLPALDPINARIRVNATPLDQDALAVNLAKDPNWHCRTYPIEYLDPETGERVATWPERFPLDYIDELREQYIAQGMLHEFQQEYMCQSEDPAAKAFNASMFKVEPIVRTWHPVQAFYDPARTTNKNSASTGKVVFSWIGNRLVVWEGDGQMWMPDEIINDIFKTDAQYEPMQIGVEEDGLNEFILQPLRQEQVKRRYTIPFKSYRAPRGKLDFIRGLQPFFKAGEIVFAKELPVLKAQLLSFPTGKIDAPNALAYALRMRSGSPVYDEFTVQSVAEWLAPIGRAPLYLCVNSIATLTAGSLVQVVDGCLHILADWVREGEPGAVLADIIREASIHARVHYKIFAPPQHFQQFDNIGLLAAARKIPAELNRGGAYTTGREELRTLLRRSHRGAPALQVAHSARWSLNAFAGGYARAYNKHGTLGEDAEQGPYRVLIEGLESFAALLSTSVIEDDHERNYAYTQGGRRYLSAMGSRQ